MQRKLDDFVGVIKGLESQLAAQKAAAAAAAAAAKPVENKEVQGKLLLNLGSGPCVLTNMGIDMETDVCQTDKTWQRSNSKTSLTTGIG